MTVTDAVDISGR